MNQVERYMCACVCMCRERDRDTRSRAHKHTHAERGGGGGGYVSMLNSTKKQALSIRARKFLSAVMQTMLSNNVTKDVAKRRP